MMVILIFIGIILFILGIAYLSLMGFILIYLKLKSLRELREGAFFETTELSLQENVQKKTTEISSSDNQNTLQAHSQIPIEQCFVLSSQQNLAYLLTDQTLSTNETAVLLQAISFFSNKGLSYKIISSQSQDCLVSKRQVPLPVPNKHSVFQFPDQLFIQN